MLPIALPVFADCFIGVLAFEISSLDSGSITDYDGAPRLLTAVRLVHM